MTPLRSPFTTPQQQSPADPAQALADRIVTAGRVRRNEIGPNERKPVTEHERLALAIVNAGRKRRNEPAVETMILPDESEE